MADSLPPSSSSSSLHGTSCTSAQRPLKRRFTSSDLDFFTPAAVSFKPRPYTPSNTAFNSLAKANASFRAHARALEPHVLPPAGMDPQPSDPNVVFIHPPFTSFPTSDIHPEGLSYQLMADNPEWFLDANDFVFQNNTNLNAMPYPSFLEPPRGWCPAKKKDLKDRGSEGWPEGEEPRLRCTFCRRTYAGVNAKSMWRRHVFEKHKIAMSNRRDGHDRPRGRGSNKENRQAVTKQSDDAHDSLVHMNVTTQAEPQNISHKSKFRTLIPETKQRLNKSDLLVAHATPTKSSASNDGRFEPHSPISPPLTPHASSSSADHSENSREQLHITSEPPAPSFPIIPESPYDPLQTPSFRHSPPRLPSDQPWRFPSPSHPLYSRTRNLSLSMLIRDLNSPISKRSPGVRGSISESPAPSPCASVSTSRRRDLADFNTPERVAKYPKPSPRILSSRSRVLLPLGDKGRYQIEESPLRKDFRPGSASGEKLRSGLIDDWFSDAPLPSSVSHDILTNNDPFVSMYSWETVPDGGNEARKPDENDVPSPDNESPVLRHASLPPGTGLGIGLLDPFSLSDTDDFLPADSDGDFDGMMTGPLVTQSDSRDGADVPAVLMSSGKDTALPPKKRRRMSE